MIAAMMDRRRAERVLFLLEREQRALMAGDLKAIGRNAKALARGAEELEALSQTRNPALMPLLERIAKTAARNCTLAEASRRGLRTAERVRADAQAAKRRLGTYTGTGARRELIMPSRSSDRRT